MYSLFCFYQRIRLKRLLNKFSERKFETNCLFALGESHNF